jgi:hypothetical protein
MLAAPGGMPPEQRAGVLTFRVIAVPPLKFTDIDPLSFANALNVRGAVKFAPSAEMTPTAAFV